MDAAIVCHGLGRSFGPRAAVSDLDLTIEHGAVFGFLGPNGAGKTTTVRMMLGLLPPSTGRIRVLGLDPVKQGEALRARTGVVLDQVGLYDRLTAWQNLDFAARVAHMSAAVRRKKIQESLERVELLDRKNDRVSGFSKGMRQKLGLARALLSNPELLILDEPTSGLDPANIKMVRELILSLAKEGGRTIFMCTHHLDEAQRICSQVGIIRSGRLVALGSPEQLGAGKPGHQIRVRATGLTPAEAHSTQWGNGVALLSATEGKDELILEIDVPNEQATETVVTTMVHQGAGIREVTPMRRSLEDVYLEIVQGDEEHE